LLRSVAQPFSNEEVKNSIPVKASANNKGGKASGGRSLCHPDRRASGALCVGHDEQTGKALEGLPLRCLVGLLIDVLSDPT
jgi:hypothetical protein